MKFHPRIWAGTALSLLMASSQSGAMSISNEFAASPNLMRTQDMLVQADCLEGETTEACALRLRQGAPAEQVPAPVPEAPPAPEAPVTPSPEAPAADKPAPEAPAAEPAPVPVPSDQPPAEQPAAEQPAPEAPAAVPAPAPSDQPPAEQPAAEPPVPETPATEPVQPAGDQSQSGEKPADPNAAPVLDSQKEAPATEGSSQPGQAGDKAAQPAPPLDQAPPPATDAAATEGAQPAEIQPVTVEKGTRVERAPDQDMRRRERPEGVDVVREIGDRIIIQINNQVIVESNDRPRMIRGAREVYYEDLPRGRTRETIVRENGTQIVTIRSRYGDVIRRSRITPDGREYVLVYVDELNYDQVGEWRDPGLDLGPIHLTIPVTEYILVAANVEDADAYYEFLEKPPIERVQRLYSIDEVKRSARVRDIARRVDLDTLTFEFGSAEIPQSEVVKLEGVAKAMERLLEKNPAETFLIEGHTDAVGSDLDNLALSDRRAEAVAEALTNSFAIPPENLVPQGYGEQYLKVNTEEANRQNRRVAVRRITPLVAPVAAAK
ncbi:OmpA family protein [Aminobacter anthyllidis]|uniref:OmpA family protein n=1 Tax=Aminobacter anthyllidis TaxID=1035067 RepID=A0A9X1AIG7_9HYPH|nr:OmpA family protein [Aminobacter anthyllidis]MBT1160199.1 OmpA family protein [Aminobacter anthyllidis]